MRPVTDRSELATLLIRDRLIHIYGLADLDEPFWSESTWYRRGNAAVGIIGLGDGGTAGYAMSRTHGDETLDLLADVVGQIPTGSWITGPIGLADRVEALQTIDRKGPHTRMVIGSDVPLSPDSRVDVLEPSDAGLIEDLHGHDPGAAFFLPSMMRTGTFVGIRDESGRLVASAGTHTASARFGVAAIGAVIVRPGRRSQGLGAAITADLVIRLRPDHETIGLNVSSHNVRAIRLYERLGFVAVAEYEEIELL